MTISALSLLEDASSMSVTGGTAVDYDEDSVEVQNGVHVADMDKAFTVRPHLTLRARNPQLQADGTYSKGKRWYTLVIPKTLADGTTAFNLIRIEEEVHPETTEAEQLNLELQGAQLLSDSDLSDFRLNGSLK
jgi:hypothetical protein